MLRAQQSVASGTIRSGSRSFALLHEPSVADDQRDSPDFKRLLNDLGARILQDCVMPLRVPWRGAVTPTGASNTLLVTFMNRVLSSLLVAFALVITGCATLPPPKDRVENVRPR